ncbi:MAG: hypothetical protein CFK52_04570 [Chloracidobacterium sp. CP2_5A]|nr:MAG: hypothetical protein CFK52_04570 [Chloracidobacterium sp. CP2_5A]
MSKQAPLSKQAPSRPPDILFFVATPGERRAVWAVCRAAFARLTLTGVGPVNAARAARATLAALPDGCRPLVAVVGLGGALAPPLSVGDVVLGLGALALDGSRYPACPAATAHLAARLTAAGVTAHRADHLTAAYVVCRAAEKRRLHAQTGAWAVDMESHAIAQSARRHGLPLLLLRVISDDARHDLPDLNAGFDAEYRVRPLGMAGLLATHPVASARFLSNLRRALMELRRVARVGFANDSECAPDAPRQAT